MKPKPSDPSKVTERWADLLQRENTADLVVRRKDDALDFVEGTVGDVGAQEISVLIQDRTLPVPRDRIFGVIYAVRAGERPRPLAEVRIDTSRLQASAMDLSEGVCRVQLSAGGGQISVPLDRIHLVEFAGRVRFLGDLPAAVTLPAGIAADEKPWYFRRGTDDFNNPLRIGSQQVHARDGLWMRSGVSVRYRLNRDYRRLLTTCGMDHNVPGLTPVRLVILGEGEERDGLEELRSRTGRLQRPRSGTACRTTARERACESPWSTGATGAGPDSPHPVTPGSPGKRGGVAQP